MIRHLLTISVILLLYNNAMAQVEMADNFRGEGKIYVVLGVMLLLLAGLFIYLFRIDKKVKNLEDK